MNRLYGIFDRIDNKVKRLPRAAQYCIGAAVVYGVQSIPGDNVMNSYHFTASGGEPLPGSFVKYVLSNANFFTQPIVQTAPMVLNRLNESTLNIAHQIVTRIPEFALHASTNILIYLDPQNLHLYLTGLF